MAGVPPVGVPPASLASTLDFVVSADESPSAFSLNSSLRAAYRSHGALVLVAFEEVVVMESLGPLLGGLCCTAVGVEALEPGGNRLSTSASALLLLPLFDDD